MSEDRRDANESLRNKAAKYGEQVVENVRAIAIYALLALGGGLAFAFLMAGSIPGLGIIAIAAFACFAIGGGFGFLFSIPRSAQAPETAPAPVAAAAGNAAGNANVQRRFIPRDNTNLEQISDWLVKILIGAGLVQLTEVKRLLLSSASRLSQCLLAAKSNGALLSQAFCTEFCLFLILYFLAIGFLTGYLVTKLWLPYVILRSSLAMQMMQDDAAREERDEGRKEGMRQTLREFGLTSADTPPDEKHAGLAASADITSDPHKGKFGGKPELNGLKLSATVAKMDDIDEDYFRITLKVTTDGKRTLDKPVTFHLHPTFPDPAPVVVPTNNEAVLMRAAWGAFTVGVTIEGEPTRLELDLVDIPDAPPLFKTR